jgi:hypothetical protein
MSIAAISGLSGISLAPPDRPSTVNQAAGTTLTATATQSAGVTQIPGVTQATGDPATKAPLPKPAQPFILVPTEPLTAAVLAELIGRQPPLNGGTVPR